MKRFLVSLLMVSVLLINPASGRKKRQLQDRVWQTGKVLDSQRSDVVVGTKNRPGVVLTNGQRITNDSTRTVYRTQETFVIEGKTHTYTASKPLVGKPVNLTVNGPITFAVEGDRLYLIDDDFKEQRTEIKKKVLHETAEQSK